MQEDYFPFYSNSVSCLELSSTKQLILLLPPKKMQKDSESTGLSFAWVLPHVCIETLPFPVLYSLTFCCHLATYCSVILLNQIDTKVCRKTKSKLESSWHGKFRYWYNYLLPYEEWKWMSTYFQTQKSIMLAHTRKILGDVMAESKKKNQVSAKNLTQTSENRKLKESW